MAFLLDVNVLIARIDPRHEHHERARNWMARHTSVDIVTCPVTENGFLRIFGHPAYPGGPGSPGSALAELRVIRGMPNHRFVGDSISIDDPTVFHSLDELGPKQLTDVYLLGLAVVHKVVFASFDGRIPVDRVVGGNTALEVIP